VEKRAGDVGRTSGGGMAGSGWRADERIAATVGNGDRCGWNGYGVMYKVSGGSHSAAA